MSLIAGVDVPLLVATTALPPPGTSLSAFIAALDGHTVDSCGGFPAGQCTALACAWCRNLGLGTPCGSCAAPDHCDGACWVGAGFPGWTWVPNTPSAVPVPGDVVAYHANCGADGIGSSGHVGIFVSGNASHFTGFDQNWNGAFCRLIAHGYECVIGWHHPTAANACAGVTCPPCQGCVAGNCVDECVAGDTCVDGVCTPPVSPPPAVSTGLLVAGLLLAGLAGVAVWEAHRHPGGARGVLDRLEGDAGSGFSHRPDAPTGPGRPSGRNAVDRAPRVAAGRVGVPGGETALGAGLARRRGLEATAIERLGTADELRAASFVLPDGTLLAWPGGQNPIRTRESASHHLDIARDLGQANIDPLLEAGWLRVQNFRSLLVTQVGQPITAAQAGRLRAGAAPFDKLVISAEYGTAYQQPQCEAIPPTPGAINACVRSVNEGIVTGRAEHEALRARIRRDHPELLTAGRARA